MTARPAPMARTAAPFARWRAALFGAALLVAATSAAAETDRATAERLMRASGMWEQLGSVAAQVRAGQQAALAQQKLPPETVDRIAALAGDAFAPGRLRGVVADVLVRVVAADDVPALLAWYDGDTGAAISRLEERSSADVRDPQAAIAESLALLAKMPDARRARLTQLVAASRAAEGMAAVAIDTTVAMQLGAQSAAPDRPGLSAAELRQSLEARRPALLVQFTQLALVTDARIYASLSDDDLGRYVAFLKTPEGGRFTAAGLGALGAAMVQAATVFGRSLPSARDSART